MKEGSISRSDVLREVQQLGEDAREALADPVSAYLRLRADTYGHGGVTWIDQPEDIVVWSRNPPFEQLYIALYDKLCVLWERKPSLPAPPAPVEDPRVGLQRIQRWCVDAERKPDSQEANGQNAAGREAPSPEAAKSHVQEVGPEKISDGDRWTKRKDAGQPGGQDDPSTPIRIDLSQWRKSKCRNLMQDLLEDDLRKGIVIRRKRHGQNAAKELRRSLRRHRFPQVASAIVSVKGKTSTVKLNIPRSKITYSSPQT